MNLADPLPAGEGLAKTPEDEDDGDTERESEEGLGVLATGTPNLLGTDSTPKDRGGEEGVDARAGHLELGIGSADSRNASHLELQDAETHEGRHERRDHLSPESMTRGNLHVVRKLKVVGEPNGVGAGDVAEGLEVIHGQGVALNPGTTDELSKHVEGDLDTGHGLDDTDRDDENQAENDTVEDDTDSGVRGPGSNTGAAESNGDDEGEEVPPLRDLGVDLHKTVVDIEDLVLLDVAVLAEAADQSLEAEGDLMSVVENGVGNGGGVDGEEEHVDHGVGGAQERGRVGLVGLLVEEAVLVNSARHVVQLAEVVVDLVGVDGEVSGVVGVGVPDGDDDEAGNKSSEELVEGGKEGNHQGVRVVEETAPVSKCSRESIPMAVLTGCSSRKWARG